MVQISPPRYKRDLYGKVQCFLARLHMQQEDQGELQIVVSRDAILEDSLNLITNLDGFTLTRRLFIKFTGEEYACALFFETDLLRGLDYGGMSRDWFLSLSRELTLPERKLFEPDPRGYFYNIHRKADAISSFQTYFYFVGQLIGMACYHGRLLEPHFSPIIYKV